MRHSWQATSMSSSTAGWIRIFCSSEGRSRRVSFSGNRPCPELRPADDRPGRPAAGRVTRKFSVDARRPGPDELGQDVADVLRRPRRGPSAAAGSSPRANRAAQAPAAKPFVRGEVRDVVDMEDVAAGEDAGGTDVIKRLVDDRPSGERRKLDAGPLRKLVLRDEAHGEEERVAPDLALRAGRRA